MNDYVLFMHDDANVGDDAAWDAYFTKLKASGSFLGGSRVGTGACFSKAGSMKHITSEIVGFIRVRAKSLEAAKQFLDGNPVYEAGGTVEIRELPKD